VRTSFHQTSAIGPVLLENGVPYRRSEVAALLEELERIRAQLESRLWRWLELALTGSFAFWSTAGLMAAWRTTNDEPSPGA
jgi:hypothetical protein